MPRISFFFLLVLLVSSVVAYDYKHNIHNITTTCTGSTSACSGNNASLCTRDFNWTGAGLCIHALDNSVPKEPFNSSTVIYFNESVEYNVVDLGIGYTTEPTDGADAYIIRDETGAIVGQATNDHTQLEMLVPITQKTYSMINITQIAHFETNYQAYMWAINISFPGVQQPGVNQLPSCSLTYPQSVFSKTNEMQYFNYDFNVNDPEYDEVWYSTGQTDYNDRYILAAPNLGNPYFCNDTNFMPLLSACQTDPLGRLLVSSGLFGNMAPMVINNNNVLVSNPDTNWTYALDAPISGEGASEVSWYPGADGQTFNVTFYLSTGGNSGMDKIEVGLKTLNSTSLEIMFADNTYIVNNISHFYYDPFYPRFIVADISTIQSWPGFIIEVTQSNGGILWSQLIATTYTPQVYAVNVKVPSFSSKGIVLRGLELSGNTSQLGLVWSTERPVSSIPVDWNGQKHLRFYGTDAYHKGSDYCMSDVIVTMGNTGAGVEPPLPIPMNGSSAQIPQDSIAATGVLGAISAVFYHFIHESGNESVFYAYGWWAYIIVLFILFFAGRSFEAAWFITNALFFFMGLFSLVSWGQTMTCMVMLFIGIAGAFTKSVSPFGGAGGNLNGPREGF